MQTSRFAVALLSVCLIGACASTASRRSDAGPGWSRATVVEVGDRTSLGEFVEDDCRRTLEREPDGSASYARVRYFIGRHAHTRIVRVPDDVQVAEDDQVYVNLKRCTAALMKSLPD